MQDKEATLEDIEFAASKRYRAKVMSYDEYRVIADTAARQIYKLYENLWVELSDYLDIKLHKKLPKAPPDFYKQYYFGG